MGGMSADRRSRRAAVAAALFFAWSAPSHAAGAAHAKLFGSTEIRSDNLGKFTKWIGMLKRYATEEPAELQVCRPSPVNPCSTARWRIFLNQIAHDPPKEQLQKVNSYINRWLYVVDPVNYGQRDYWATPVQFFAKNGDCEDYAIAKYVSLLHLGFDKEDMRLVILQDLNLKVPHAVLVVYVDGEPLVLDNQIKQVVHAGRIHHYKPIYSINQSHWWLHRS